MKIEFEDIQAFKKKWGSNCAKCKNPINNIWLDKDLGVKASSGYFRCTQHPPDFSHRKFYKLDEKEMFVFRCL